jgi:hypothetical protein
MAKPLLEIRVDDLDSVPVVYYKGKQLPNALIHIGYDWRTRDETGLGKHVVSLEYVKDHDDGVSEIRTIKRERLG